MNPVPVTADTATFLDLPYRQARSEMNQIATGNIQRGDAAISDYYAFALSPERVDEPIVDVVADCLGGGTIEYLYAA